MKPESRRKIALLEDEAERVAAMTLQLRRRISGCEIYVFDNAPEMVEWLRRQLGAMALICLDHDLGPNRIRRGVSFDPGVGQDVVDFLATQSPVCPVIVHTTNTLAVPRMIDALEQSGWRVSRVSPYDDLRWIDEIWIGEVEFMFAE